MGLPSGTSYFVPIVVNRTKIGETTPNILYQIDLSSKLASNSVFKGFITTDANIAVYDADLDSTRPRRVVLDLVNNILLIYWDGAASTTIDKKFYICVGSGVNQVNSTSAFTNSGITNYFGFNESGSEATTLDYATGTTATIVAPAVTGNSGGFYKGVTILSTGFVSFASELIGTGERTISCMINPSAPSSSSYLFDNGECQFAFVTNGSAAARRLYFTSNAPTYLSNSQEDIVVGSQHLVSASRSITGAGKVVVNGVQRASGATGSPVNGTNNFRLGLSVASGNQYLGTIDEFSLTSDVKTVEYEVTRYNMLLGFSTFFFVNSGFFPNKNKHHSIHTGV